MHAKLMVRAAYNSAWTCLGTRTFMRCRVATTGTMIIGQAMVRKTTQGQAWAVEVRIGGAEVQEMEGK